MNLNVPAYQGRGWKNRVAPFARELDSRIWSDSRVNSEWSDLKAVMLYAPGNELAAIRDPRAAQYLRRVSPSRLRKELQSLARVYRSLGIEVVFLNRALVSKQFGAPPPNLMFMRDLFFNTPGGCVLSRMASRVRAGEEKFTAAQLAALAVPVRASIGGRGLFEGADALWLDARTVVCGIGQRTNREGFKQLSALLAEQGVRVIAVRMPPGVQHLLGLLQIVDDDLAVVRPRKLPAALRQLLKSRRFRLVELPETKEVLQDLSMNFVCVSRRRIVMAAGCSQTEILLREAGIRIAARVSVEELAGAAGGIGCATGILSRRLCR